MRAPLLPLAVSLMIACGDDEPKEPIDEDEDGFAADDGDPAVNPDAVEICNGVDDDCAGGIDDGLLHIELMSSFDQRYRALLHRTFGFADRTVVRTGQRTV